MSGLDVAPDDARVGGRPGRMGRFDAAGVAEAATAAGEVRDRDRVRVRGTDCGAVSAPVSGAVPAAGGDVGPQVATFVGRVDGAEVSVGVQPGAQAGRLVVLLRVSSPLLETVAGAYLAPDEADRIAASLSAAAFAAACQSSAAGASPEGAAVSGCAGPVPTERPGHTEITAVEGTPAAELSAAIALLPDGAVLTDFCSDADVCLIFGPSAPRSRIHGLPAGRPVEPPAAA